MKANGLKTAGRTLVYAYSPEQAEVIVAIAGEHDIRAVGAAAFIAPQVRPDLDVLDSTGAPVTTLDALPKNT